MGYISRDESARTLRLHLTILAGARVAGMSGYWAAFAASLPAALARPHPATWLAVLTGCWTAPAIGAGIAGRLIDSAGPRAVATVAWSAAALACALAAAAPAEVPVLAASLAVISLAFGIGMSAGEAAPSWMLSRPDTAELARAGTWLGVALALSVGVGALGSSALAVIGEQAAWLLATGLCTAGAALSVIVPAARPSSATATPTAADDTDRLAVGARSGIRGVMAATLGIFVGYGLITILTALYVTSELHVSYVAYGWLLSIWALADALTLAVITRRLRLVTGSAAMFAAAAILAVGEGLAFGTSWLPASAAGFAVYGIGSALFYMAARVALTRTTPVARHGRVFAAWWSVQAVGMAIPALFASPLVSAVGLRPALLIAPALAALTAVAAAVFGIRTATTERP